MAWILDVVFFVVLLIGSLIGAKVGLLKGVCKIAGWVLSILVPFVWCTAFKGALENWFGMVTAIADALNNATLAEWISIAISFVGLFILVRVGTFLLGKLGTVLVNGLKPAAIANQVLGAVLGLVEAFIVAYFLMLVCGWLPIESVHAFIESSTVVGAIYRSNLISYLPF